MHSKLLSAICFSLDQSKILTSGNGLSLYLTILTFNDQKEEGFGKHCGNQHFLLLPTLFSALSRREVIILAMFNLSSANAFNLVISKVLLFGKGLRKQQNFRPVIIESIILQTTKY